MKTTDMKEHVESYENRFPLQQIDGEQFVKPTSPWK